MRALLSETTDTARVLLYDKLAKQYRNSNIDSALYFAEQTQLLATDIDYQRGQLIAINRIAQLKIKQGNYDKATQLLTEALAIDSLHRFQAEFAESHLLYGNVLRRQQNFAEAIQHYLEAERIFVQINYRERLPSIYNSLGLIFKNNGNRDKAIYYYQQAITIAEEIGREDILARIATNVASIYAIELEEQSENASHRDSSFNQALRWYRRAAAIQNKGQDRAGLAITCNNIGRLYLAQSAPDSALHYLQLSIHYKRQVGEMVGAVITWNNLAEWHLNQEQPKQAIPFLDSALADALPLQNPAIIADIYHNLGLAHAQSGDTKRGYELSLKAMSYRDSASMLEQQELVTELELKFESEKKEQQIIYLARKDSLQQEALNYEMALNEQQERDFVLLMIGSGVLIVLFSLLFYLQRKRRKAAELLASQNKEIFQRKIDEQLRTQELETIHATLEAQENERRRIAADLHDRLGSMLSTVKLHYQSFQPSDDHEKQNLQKLENAHALLDDTINEVRRISHNMVSGVLMNFGLIPALRDLCDNLNNSGAISAKLLTYGPEERLPSEVEVGLYRVVQELTSNVLKHADAKQLVIQLNRREDALSLSVEDNGTGFSRSDKTPGMGLRNIESRINQIDGDLIIDSQPGRGTTILIEIPLRSLA